MKVLFFVSFLVLLFSQEDDLEESQQDLTKKLSACWLVSVKEMGKNPDQMKKIFEHTALRDITNQTQVHYKVQMDIIGRCFGFIDILNAEKIINDLNEEDYKGPSMIDVISDFTYEKYLNPEQPYELDQLDITLLNIVRNLETDLQNYKQEQETKNQGPQKIQIQKQESKEEWRQSVEKRNAERNTQSNEQEDGLPNVVVEEEVTANQYLVLGSILGSLSLGAFWIIRKMNSMGTTKVERLKKTKSD